MTVPWSLLPLIRQHKDGRLATVHHDYYKLGQSILNPFSSSQSLRSLQPILEEGVNALLEALTRYAKKQNGPSRNIMHTFSGATNGMTPKSLAV